MPGDGTTTRSAMRNDDISIERATAISGGSTRIASNMRSAGPWKRIWIGTWSTSTSLRWASAWNARPSKSWNSMEGFGSGPRPLLERGPGTSRDHSVGKVDVEVTDENHRDPVAPFGEPVLQARDHRTRSPRGERREFGGDEDDVHDAIVAESGT